MNNLVFVYGTLKHGEGNSYILKNSTFIGEAKLQDKMTMRQLGFPAIKDGDGGIVLGHLFEVDSPETWHRLDSLENNGVMYERQERSVLFEGGTAKAWVYIATDKFWHRCDNYPEITADKNGHLVWG